MSREYKTVKEPTISLTVMRKSVIIIVIKEREPYG